MGQLPTIRPVPPQPQQQVTPLPTAFIQAASVIPAMSFQQKIRIQAASGNQNINVGPNTDYLLIVASIRSTIAALRDDVVWGMNGDVGANYSWDQLFQSNGAVGASNSSAATNAPQIANCPGNTADAGQFGWAFMFFTDLQSTTGLHRGVGWSSHVATFKANSVVVVRDGYWNMLAPVRSIAIGLAGGLIQTGSLFKI